MYTVEKNTLEVDGTKRPEQCNLRRDDLSRQCLLGPGRGKVPMITLGSLTFTVMTTKLEHVSAFASLSLMDCDECSRMRRLLRS